MSKQHRKEFIANTALLSAGLLMAVPLLATTKKKMVIHHVFSGLKIHLQKKI